MTHKSGKHKHKCDGDHAILDAALRIAALAGWRRFSFASVAEEAGVPLAQVLRHYPTRAALICAWSRVVDRAMLGDDIVIDPRETVRDRLFDLMMRRLDALAPHKEALRALVPSFGRDLSLMGAFFGSLDRSMAVMLEAAGVDVIGARGMVQVKGLKGVYLNTLRAWLKDETPDMAQTMASLDKTLDRVDSVAKTVFGRGCGPFSRHEASSPMDPTDAPMDPASKRPMADAAMDATASAMDTAASAMGTDPSPQPAP